VNGQKGKLALLRKRFKLPAGTGYAVNFAVDIGKERDSQVAARSLAQKMASHAPKTKRRLSFVE